MNNIISNAEVLSRNEMKNVMAGGQVYITCDGCMNSTCQGWADDCVTGGYEICGPGYAGDGGPVFTCTSIGEA